MSAITSRKDTDFHKPTGGDRVSLGDLGYFRARNKNRVYDVVVTEFEDSGLTQAELAARLGKGRDQICRLLGAPGNWTLDTVSDLLFAISGSELEYTIARPLEAAARNLSVLDLLDMGSATSGAPHQPAELSAASTSEISSRVRVVRELVDA